MVDGRSLSPGWDFAMVHSWATVREKPRRWGKLTKIEGQWGWKSSDRDMVLGGAVKERKGWESSNGGKGGRGSRGWGGQL
jgi:hypothetical protein